MTTETQSLTLDLFNRMSDAGDARETAAFDHGLHGPTKLEGTMAATREHRAAERAFRDAVLRIEHRESALEDALTTFLFLCDTPVGRSPEDRADDAADWTRAIREARAALKLATH